MRLYGTCLEYITARSAHPGTSWRASARFFPTVCMANRRPSGGELTPEHCECELVLLPACGAEISSEMKFHEISTLQTRFQ